MKKREVGKGLFINVHSQCFHLTSSSFQLKVRYYLIFLQLVPELVYVRKPLGRSLF